MKKRAQHTKFIIAGLAVLSVLILSKAYVPVSRLQPPEVARNSEQNESDASSSSEAEPKSSDSSSQTTPKERVERSASTEKKRYYLLAAPNDPLYGSAWYFAAVNAPSAWDTTTGSSDVTVAVIDSGFALSHQDLQANWQYNDGENGGGKESNGVDDDGNGYVDDYRGWDFVVDDNSPQAGVDDPLGDGVSHGTETAGLVGAVGDNGVGTTAISQQVSVMPLQVMDDAGSGYSNDVAEAIYYAVDNGADVINMSLGTSGNDPTVEAAVEYAYDNDVVVVAAAGNCGYVGADGPCTGQVTGYITFPANNDKVIAVGATTSSNARAYFSSYGERLDIVAPGYGTFVYPTVAYSDPGGLNVTNAYSSALAGTSYSSPIVASTAALIKSIRPDTSVGDMRALLLGNTQQLGGTLYTTSFGHGLLNVSKSISVANALNGSTSDVPQILEIDSLRPVHDASTVNTSTFGCQSEALTYCTVSFTNQQKNYNRFLPYLLTDQSGLASWQWSGGILATGDWQIQAQKGDALSGALLYSR